MNRWLMKCLLAFGVAASLAACGGNDDAHPPPGNIVEVAQANGFTALIAAATKAGLAPALTDAKSEPDRVRADRRRLRLARQATRLQ